uniref:Uncharacterized protein n=1 Tax=Globisporangium ultimum (strain ATCC 200006 / CBS 805.95 / DAOM BR144) TaxID=431595 RepID=K3X051_GLOUD
MNVTRHNFEACFADLKKDIELPTCRFVAIDTEFTGLSPNEDKKERFLDTLEERYQKVKAAGESFLITQFGLSTVHIDDDEQFQIKTWNFYIFPRPYGQTDHRFLCQASSLQFLSEHGFDFNKFIADGIPFLNLARTKGLKKRLEKRIEMLHKPAKGNLSLSEEGSEFQADVTAQLDAWLADGAKKGSKLVVPTRNSYYSMIVHETVREKASYLYSEAVTSGGVEVSFVSQKIKQELIAAKVQAMKDELDQAIGFSRVIDVLSKSKKPVIGHNALLDFVYVFNQFYKPLPPTLAEFKEELVKLFPAIYDTKHVALRSSGLMEKLQSTGLSSLFEYMREHVKPTPETLLSSDPRFDGYRAALQAEGDADDSTKLLCHEAGFDAFMTAVCFLGLLAHDAQGGLVEDASVGSVARLNERLAELDAFKNQLNLMISDERYLDLTNVAQTIDRSRVVRVSSSKRKLHQVRMEDLFLQTKVQRVLREGEQDAFVVLADASYELNADASAEDLTITTYAQFIASRKAQADAEKTAANQKLLAQLQTEYPEDKTAATPFAGLVPTAENSSSWTRCTIS